MSFKEIAEKLNCKKHLVMKIEKQIIQDFINHKYKNIILDFILIDLDCKTIQQIKLADLNNLLEYDSAKKLLYLINRSTRKQYHQ